MGRVGVGQSITLYYMGEGEGQNAPEIVLRNMWMIPNNDEVSIYGEF